jgi:hypothetical protein
MKRQNGLDCTMTYCTVLSASTNWIFCIFWVKIEGLINCSTSISQCRCLSHKSAFLPAAGLIFVYQNQYHKAPKYLANCFHEGGHLNPILHTTWLDNHALTLKINSAKYHFHEKSRFLLTFLKFCCESRKI